MQVLIDSSKKYAVTISLSLVLSIIAVLWSVFVRPQMVFASDLEEVSKKTDMNTEVIQLIREEQIEFRIDYFEDQIRVLEAYKVDGKATQVDLYRLDKYRDDLEKMQIKRSNFK